MLADPLSGIAIIIFIAFGVLTFVVLFIFANRQIKRFSLKSKPGPHTPIGQGAPKSLQNEINRRLDIVKNITYQPVLLKKSDHALLLEENADIPIPCHLYRMKAMDSVSKLDDAIAAVDASRKRTLLQDYRVYLIRLFQNGFFGQLEIAVIHRYADLYELARHEPGEFNKDHYEQFMYLMSQIQQNISSRGIVRAPVVKPSAAESARNINIGKVPTVPSCIQMETPIEEQKDTFETAV